MARRTYTKAKVAIAGAAAGVTVLGATWFAQNQPASATDTTTDPVTQVAPAAASQAPATQGSSATSNTSSTGAAATVAPKTTTTTPKKVVTPAARRSRGS